MGQEEGHMRTTLAVVASLALAAGARAYADEAHKGQGTSQSGDQTSGAMKGGVPSQSRDVQGNTGAPGTPVPDKDPASKAAAAPQLQSVVGTVVKLDENSMTVKTSPLSDPHQLKLSQSTRFMREGDTISRDQIQEGDQVRATFSSQGKDPSAATEISVIQKGEGAGGTMQQGQGSGGAAQGRQESGADQGQKAAPSPGGSSGAR
jgi:hypothetical protein